MGCILAFLCIFLLWSWFWIRFFCVFFAYAYFFYDCYSECVTQPGIILWVHTGNLVHEYNYFFYNGNSVGESDVYVDISVHKLGDLFSLCYFLQKPVFISCVLGSSSLNIDQCSCPCYFRLRWRIGSWVFVFIWSLRKLKDKEVWERFRYLLANAAWTLLSINVNSS